MRVCVIGAGVSGLPAVKACVEEGLQVDCYERTGDIGGLWNYRPELREKGGTVMKSTIVNTSKEMMAYSDFPPPAEFANFMHNTFVMQYLRRYAEHFDLLKHVHLNTEVLAVRREEMSDATTWIVNLADGRSEKFDALMLCTGHHSVPQYPRFLGSRKFAGRTMHAHDYQDSSGLEGRDVVIVGIGNSALDIAVELSRVARSVRVSTRRGAWIFNRCVAGGMPYDVVLQTRLYEWLRRRLPWSLINDFMEHRLQQRMCHDLYGLRPRHRFFQQHPTVNDALCNLLASNLVTIVDDIEVIEPTAIVCQNGRRYAADVIIYATGYTFGFPYLQPANLIPIKDHAVDLYKHVFPLDTADVAIIGLIQPIGSVAPIAEMQARWAARVFATRGSILPPIAERRADVARKRALMRRRYFDSPKHTLQVDAIPYVDELAELVGCRPSLSEMVISEPRLALRLFVGANWPYVYRLFGPHSWAGARDAIWTAPSRVKFPLKQRQCRTRRHIRRGTVDEWTRYVSIKWCAGWTIIVLIAGLWTFCSGPTGMAAIVYSGYVIIFLFLFAFMLLWFDFQYDMSTIF